MTIEEMKLAVAGKLPEVLWYTEQPRYYWRPELKRELHWPTEGLQVCWEAEKLLSSIEYIKYQSALARVVWGTPITMSSTTRILWEATYEQRLEALCRVWWPERFK